MKKQISFVVVGVLLLAVLAWAGTTNFDAVTVAPTTNDTYGLRVDNSSGTRVYSVNSSGNEYVAGTLAVTGATTLTGAVTAASTLDVTGVITAANPVLRIGFTSYAYTAGSGATYSVASTDTSPAVYRITGGSGTTTFVMSYTGTAAANAGKLFYIINSSSNTVTFKQSGVTGVSVATLKIVTVVGNGTDFERITADQ